MEEISGKRLNTTAGRMSLDGSSPPYWRGEEGERDMLTGPACFLEGSDMASFFFSICTTHSIPFFPDFLSSNDCRRRGLFDCFYRSTALY